jgi:hypothetical protein
MATAKKVTKAAKTTKKRLPRPAGWRAVLLGTILFVGLGIGLLTVFKAGADQQRIATDYATGSQLEASRKAITEAYLFTSAGNCTSASTADATKAAYQELMFYKYLRVNSHNDRAVIRDCVGVDHLLARIDGKWKMTDVNMALDASANPKWQMACDIADITRADTKVRPENSSIDAANLKMCQGLADNKILRLQDL